MVLPATPQRRPAPEVGTPSPRKQAEMAHHYEATTDVMKNFVNQATGAIGQIMADAVATLPAKEASIFLIKSMIDNVITTHGIDFDLEFKNPLPTPQSIDDGNFIDDTGAPANGIPNAGQEPNLANTQAMPNSTTTNQAWKQVLVQEGLKQGTGTYEEPLFVGGTHVSAEPPIIPISFAPGQGITQDRLEEVANLLFDEFSRLQWRGKIQFREVWQRLHKWAIIGWVNFFIGEFFGNGGIVKLNHILKASDKVNVHGESRADADRAAALSQSPQLSPLERAFFLSMSASIMSGLSNTDAFARFRNNHQCVVAIFKYHAIITEVTDHPRGALAQRIRKRGPAASGLNVQNQVAEACAINMCWDRTKFQQWVDRHNVLARCTFKFTGGFILFVNTSMMTMARNSGRGAIEEIVEIVDRVFPEFKTILQEVYNEVGVPLLSDLPAVNRQVFGRKIATGAGVDDLITRIKAMKAGTE